MCGEGDESLSQGNEVLVTSQEEAEIAVTGGWRPLRYEAQLDCLVPWFDGAATEDPAEPSEASCADWSAGFIGLKPRRQAVPPAPLSIPLRALSHPLGSAPLIEHLVSSPRLRGDA